LPRRRTLDRGGDPVCAVGSPGVGCGDDLFRVVAGQDHHCGVVLEQPAHRVLRVVVEFGVEGVADQECWIVQDRPGQLESCPLRDGQGWPPRTRTVSMHFGSPARPRSTACSKAMTWPTGSPVTRGARHLPTSEQTITVGVRPDQSGHEPVRVGRLRRANGASPAAPRGHTRADVGAGIRQED